MFTNDASFLTSMMNNDIYCIMDVKEDMASMIKVPENQTEEDTDKYLHMSNMAINSFDLQDVVQRIAGDCDFFPFVEVFCNIDKEPERYYSSSWRNCRKEYPFTILKTV